MLIYFITDYVNVMLADDLLQRNSMSSFEIREPAGLFGVFRIMSFVFY
ncbi:MAG: hypothetical protein R2942_09370 [Ignavibacteria bacterium]